MRNLLKRLRRRPERPATPEDFVPNDVADWGDKDISNAYPPGTKFTDPNGELYDPSEVPDIFGGEERPDQPGR